MEWWQIASAVVGFIGGAIGIATFAFRLAENHRPPRVTLEKIDGDGWSVFIVEVSNPGLVPSTIIEAGLAFGSMRDEKLVFDEKKCPLTMTPPGEAGSGEPYLVREKDMSFVLAPRSIVRAAMQMSLLRDAGSRASAAPVGGSYNVRGYCVAAHPGLWRDRLRLSKAAHSVLEEDSHPR